MAMSMNGLTLGDLVGGVFGNYIKDKWPGLFKAREPSAGIGPDDEVCLVSCYGVKGPLDFFGGNRHTGDLMEQYVYSKYNWITGGRDKNLLNGSFARLLDAPVSANGQNPFKKNHAVVYARIAFAYRDGFGAPIGASFIDSDAIKPGIHSLGDSGKGNPLAAFTEIGVVDGQIRLLAKLNNDLTMTYEPKPGDGSPSPAAGTSGLTRVLLGPMNENGERDMLAGSILELTYDNSLKYNRRTGTYERMNAEQFVGMMFAPGSTAIANSDFSPIDKNISFHRGITFDKNGKILPLSDKELSFLNAGKVTYYDPKLGTWVDVAFDSEKGDGKWKGLPTVNGGAKVRGLTYSGTSTSGWNLDEVFTPESQKAKVDGKITVIENNKIKILYRLPTVQAYTKNYVQLMADKGAVILWSAMTKGSKGEKGSSGKQTPALGGEFTTAEVAGHPYVYLSLVEADGSNFATLPKKINSLSQLQLNALSFEPMFKAKQTFSGENGDFAGTGVAAGQIHELVKSIEVREDGSFGKKEVVVGDRVNIGTGMFEPATGKMFNYKPGDKINIGTGMYEPATGKMYNSDGSFRQMADKKEIEDFYAKYDASGVPPERRQDLAGRTFDWRPGQRTNTPATPGTQINESVRRVPSSGANPSQGAGFTVDARIYTVPTINPATGAPNGNQNVSMSPSAAPGANNGRITDPGSDLNGDLGATGKPGNWKPDVETTGNPASGNGTLTIPENDPSKVRVNNAGQMTNAGNSRVDPSTVTVNNSGTMNTSGSSDVVNANVRVDNQGTINSTGNTRISNGSSTTTVLPGGSLTVKGDANINGQNTTTVGAGENVVVDNSAQDTGAAWKKFFGDVAATLINAGHPIMGGVLTYINDRALTNEEAAQRIAAGETIPYENLPWGSSSLGRSFLNEGANYGWTFMGWLTNDVLHLNADAGLVTEYNNRYVSWQAYQDSKSPLSFDEWKNQNLQKNTLNFLGSFRLLF